MRCGWCYKEPHCEKVPGGFRCPSCKALYPVREKSGKEVIQKELTGFREEKPFVPQSPPEKPKREKKEVPLLKVFQRKRFSDKYKDWLKAQDTRNLKCSKCGDKLLTFHPSWGYRGEDWFHECSGGVHPAT